MTLGHVVSVSVMCISGSNSQLSTSYVNSKTGIKLALDNCRMRLGISKEYFMRNDSHIITVVSVERCPGKFCINSWTVKISI